MKRFLLAALCAAVFGSFTPVDASAATISASQGYYTYEGKPSSRSSKRLFADKASAIGFPTKNTISFLLFNRADLPSETLASTGRRALLRLTYDPSLARFFRLANSDNPVKVGAYGLNDAWNATAGNDANVVYGTGGAAAADSRLITKAGVYTWDVTTLVDSWISNPSRTTALALSGIYGNTAPTNGYNAYAAFRPVGADNGAPALRIEPVPLPMTAALLISGLGAVGAAGRKRR